MRRTAFERLKRFWGWITGKNRREEEEKKKKKPETKKQEEELEAEEPKEGKIEQTPLGEEVKEEKKEKPQKTKEEIEAEKKEKEEEKKKKDLEKEVEKAGKKTRGRKSVADVQAILTKNYGRGEVFIEGISTQNEINIAYKTLFEQAGIYGYGDLVMVDGLRKYFSADIRCFDKNGFEMANLHLAGVNIESIISIRNMLRGQMITSNFGYVCSELIDKIVRPLEFSPTQGTWEGVKKIESFKISYRFDG